MICIGLMKYMQEKKLCIEADDASCTTCFLLSKNNKVPGNPPEAKLRGRVGFLLQTQTEVGFDSLHHRAGDGICSFCAVL